MKKLFFLVSILLLGVIHRGRAGEIDSLKDQLRKSAPDSTKAGLKLRLSDLLAKNECASAKTYAAEALSFYTSNGDEKKQAVALERMAGACTYAADFEQAIDYSIRALAIHEKHNDKKAISYLENKLGLVYYQLGNYKKAFEYYRLAMLFYRETNDQEGQAFLLNNLGNIYEKQEKFDSALINFKLSLKMKQELGDTRGMAASINNIGNIYFHKADYSAAIEYWKKSLKLKEELDDKPGITNTLQNIGYGYFYMKQYDQAIEYISKGLSVARQINNKHYIKEAYVKLSDVYQETKNWEKAFEYTQLFGAMKDTIYNEGSSKQIAEMETKYQTEKKEKAIELQSLQLSKQDLELNKRQIIIYTAGGSLLLMLALAFFIYRGYRQKQKANVIITLQKEEVEKKNELIEEQKRLVEERNKEVMDSINYAKRIQDALLKEEEHVSSRLPAHFVLFKPKDIVSGDFYWGMEKKGYWFLCVADCTGHGVPGAFMSMLGIAFLNEINAVENILTPAEILDKLREKIVKELKQTGTAGESKDGMDISMARLELQTNELQWAGANNPLYHLRNGEIHEIKANKQPIGFSFNAVPFTNHEVSLQGGDTIYLFSDGYADQFGGPKLKKFMSRKFQQTLLAISTESLPSQKELLNRTFEDWRGNLEQLDDVAVIGFRV
jgi:serine phosphatase RsbU (regulator of sigma subunit)